MTAVVILLFVCVGLFVLGVAALTGDDMSKSISRGVASALDDAKKPGGLIEQAVWKYMEDLARENRPVPPGQQLTRTGFMWEIAFEMIRAGKLSAKDAKARAEACFADMLKDDGIEFRDPAYAWDKDAACILAREYEIDHWETA